MDDMLPNQTKHKAFSQFSLSQGDNCGTPGNELKSAVLEHEPLVPVRYE